MKAVTMAQTDDGSVTLTPLAGGRFRVESRSADGRVVFADEEMGPHGAAALAAHYGDDLPRLLALAGDDGDDANRHTTEETVTTAELTTRIWEYELRSCCDRNGVVQEERVADLAARSGVPYTATRTAVDQVLAGGLPRQGGDDAKIRERMRQKNIEYAEAASELAAAGALKEV